MGWLQLGVEVENQQGICDGSVHDIPTRQFDEYHKQCTRSRRISLGDDYVAVLVNGDIPVSTRYVPLYRIHSKEYFHSAEHFFLNWDESSRRLNQLHRFSPADTLGFYFGLTLDAALDEAKHYAAGGLSEKHQIILVMDCCLDNILYLMHPLVIGDIWKKAGLPETDMFQMYLKLMDTDTNNEVCHRIGLWARRRGYDGLIYPSARYGQRYVSEAAQKGLKLIPAVNFVPLGTKICGYSVEPAMYFYQQLYHYIQPSSGQPEVVPVFAEPNLVLFNNNQITGFDRAIFYWTFPLKEAKRVAKSDRRLGSKSYTVFTQTKTDVSIWFESIFNKWLAGDLLQ